MAEGNVQKEVTRILLDLDASPEPGAPSTERLLELVYDELHRMAAGIMRRERVNHTLQPTALVHELYMKLVDQTQAQWKDRAHFLGISARAMRQILIDHARRHTASKRGGDAQRVTLDEALVDGGTTELELVHLDDALQRLSDLDERAARVAELRIFGGLTVKETAQAVGVSARTVDDDWAMARMWLTRELTGE